LKQKFKNKKKLLFINNFFPKDTPVGQRNKSFSFLTNENELPSACTLIIQFVGVLNTSFYIFIYSKHQPTKKKMCMFLKITANKLMLCGNKDYDLFNSELKQQKETIKLFSSSSYNDFDNSQFSYYA
jgi:hypothetical protein